MLYLSFWAGILKNYCHICHQRPPIYLTAKFCAKTRILTFGTKMPYLGVLGSNFEKPLSCLKSVPSNLSYSKVWCKKIKILKFGTENARFGYFGARI